MLADLILILAGAYTGIGLVFAILFSAIGTGRIDPAAKTAPLGFRLVIIPGAMALWPWLAIVWFRSRRQEHQ